MLHYLYSIVDVGHYRYATPNSRNIVIGIANRQGF